MCYFSQGPSDLLYSLHIKQSSMPSTTGTHVTLLHDLPPQHESGRYHEPCIAVLSDAAQVCFGVLR